MKRLWCVAVLPMLMLSSGCASHAPDRAPKLKLAGIVAKSTLGSYAFANFDKSFYRGKSFRRDFESHRPFHTTQYLKIKVSQQGPDHYHNFFAVFGPNPNVPEVASARLNNSEPVLQLDSGWAYLDGSYPNALITKDSDWVSAGAQGTKMIVRIVEGKREYYVILLDDNNSGATINYQTCDGSTGTINNTAGGGWYIKVKECDVTESNPLPTDHLDLLWQWLDSVKLIYNAAS